MVRSSIHHFLIPVFRYCLVFVLMLTSALGVAQRDSSLTQDFAKLSAKERARIAAREDLDAAVDTAFQARMGGAEQRFQQGAFQEALDLYRSARAMRPYNVHPKVKIQDLEAMIAREQTPVPSPSPEVLVVEDPAPLPLSVPSPKVEAIVVEALPAPIVVAPVVPAPPKEIRTRTPVPVFEEAVAPSPPLVDGTQERTFKEGRAVVLERQVVMQGHPNVWRMVTHPWGEVVYFKDGDPVPARVWKEQFGEQ